MEERLVEEARDGKVESVRDLLADNPAIDVNWSAPNGKTALFWASMKDHDSVVSLLLRHRGIKVNLQMGSANETSFFVACKSGSAQAVKVLLEDAAVNVDLPDEWGLTPLVAAIDEGHVNVVMSWIASGRKMDLGKPGDESTDAIGRAEKNAEQEPGLLTLLLRFKVNPAQTREDVKLELRGENMPPVSLVSLSCSRAKSCFSIGEGNFATSTKDSPPEPAVTDIAQTENGRKRTVDDREDGEIIVASDDDDDDDVVFLERPKPRSPKKKRIESQGDSQPSPYPPSPASLGTAPSPTPQDSSPAMIPVPTPSFSTHADTLPVLSLDGHSPPSEPRDDDTLPMVTEEEHPSSQVQEEETTQPEASTSASASQKAIPHAPDSHSKTPALVPASSPKPLFSTATGTTPLPSSLETSRSSHIYFFSSSPHQRPHNVPTMQKELTRSENSALSAFFLPFLSGELLSA